MLVSSLRNPGNRFFDLVSLRVLPIGLLLLLSALFFLPERSLHHKLYYGLFSIPTLLALCVKPHELLRLLREPLVLLFLAFSGYAMLTLLWSPTDAGGELVKRPLHTLMLFLGMGLLLRHRPEALKPIMLGAALIVLAGTSRDLYLYAPTATAYTRLIGTGALDNPLLSSHLFGFFSIYWLWLAVESKRLHHTALCLLAFMVMFVAVLATGSRTPLVALTLGASWLAVLCWNRRSIPLLAAAPLAVIAILLLAPHLITARGDSYRLEIWQQVWTLFMQHPLLGNGYDAPLSIDPGTGYALSEPHSFAMGVLYNIGLIGFLPWIGMLGYALYSGWRHRALPIYRMATALLMFGIGAGLTEGGGILSRPKEHWFLLWIPLALVAGLNIARRAGCLVKPTRRVTTAAEYANLTTGARVIEEDGLGPKVLQLQDGSFLKLFRRRAWYTSGAFNPYSLRFVRNSQRLAALGIATPPILDLLTLDDGSQGVRYQPLPGQTLRQALAACSSPAERQRLVHRLGEYIGRLHRQGVYFRSLHLGNVLLLDNGAFGLIDLADMRLLPSALSPGLCQRNLKHMQRYPEDSQWLFDEQVDALLDGYANAASPVMSRALREQLSHSPGTAS